MNIVPEKGLSFDDVLLVPQESAITSRFSSEISLSTTIVPGITLQYPLISANMSTVTESNMAIKMAELGSLGIIHRFMDPKQQRTELAGLDSPRVICIGVGKDGIERLQIVMDLYSKKKEIYPAVAVLIDIAHGHSKAMIEQIKLIKKLYPRVPIIAGNVATGAGARALAIAGADCIKVGVGCGQICRTTTNTGCGVPQLTAINEAYKALQNLQKEEGFLTIIADGGIRNGGDAVKALAAGADAVMVGKLFAGTDEAPNAVHLGRSGTLVKTYMGMASKQAQEEWKGYATSVEGEKEEVPWTGPLEDIFTGLVNNILSGFSYQNSRGIKELQERALFIRRYSIYK